MAEVWIPTNMQQLTNGRRQINVAGSSVRQIIANLDAAYPGTANTLLDAEGIGISPELAVVVDNEIAGLGLLEPVSNNSEVHFIPAISGGFN